MAEIGV